jgi:hypothetical protein
MSHHFRVQFDGVDMRTRRQQELRQRPLTRADFHNRRGRTRAHARRDLLQDRTASEEVLAQAFSQSSAFNLNMTTPKGDANRVGGWLTKETRGPESHE